MGWQQGIGAGAIPRPGERKMKIKVLLMLVVLFACSMFMAHGKRLRTFIPRLKGRTMGNLTTRGCYSEWDSSDTSDTSMNRCFMLQGCCYAKLFARRCRFGPIPPFLEPREEMPICGFGTRCEKGACRCEQEAWLCRRRSQGLRKRRSKCRGRAWWC